MTRFSASNDSKAVVEADRSKIWAVLTDPDLLAELTPLLRRIDVDGEMWRWQLIRLSAAGVGVSTTFTERMHFDEGRRIEFSHEPPKGTTERTGVNGFYDLSDADGGTALHIRLTMHVDLPLSRAAKPVVVGTMNRAMRHTGDRFAANLLKHLGIPPDRQRKVSS
ncbi:MAG TPA: SRPBCC family protein [Pseudonocardia sp.]|jgi:hypothetical protein|nr:SRPBCC family protein [Pseudonocardia sp.]